MWIETAPSILMLTIVGWYIRSHRQQPVLLIYVLITACYLNVFPMLNYLLSEGGGMESFSYYQWLVVLFFELPLLTTAHFVAGRSLREFSRKPERATLSPWLPLLLIILLAGFWYVALRYDLFYRRLGHAVLQSNTAEVPLFLLFIYRSAVETSFFVLMFMWTMLHYVSVESRYYRGYKWAFIIYLGSFLLFYISNSRMHVVLLLLCAFCTHPKFVEIIQRRIRLLPLGFGLAALLIGLTLLRELVLEDNNRVDTTDYVGILRTILWLIAARLDSLYILHELNRVGFNGLSFDLTGFAHAISFTFSFFIDPQTYNAIKESLVTSPTVVIVNRMLGSNEVDFPKSMALDMLLSFGFLGLLVTAVLLGNLIGRIQCRINSFRGYQIGFCVSLYALPMLLQFEKEFIGFLFAFLKWLPALLLIYWLRPRFNYLRPMDKISILNTRQSA